MANPTELHASLEPGSAQIPLFTLDATKQIGEVFRFTNDAGGTSAPFNGITYIALPVVASGFEEAAAGLEARPKIKVIDYQRSISSILAGRSIAGATLSRTLVYAKNLDNGSSPNPNKFTPPDLFIVENMIDGRFGEYITWQLIVPHDIPDLTTPRMTFTRDWCPGIGRANLR